MNAIVVGKQEKVAGSMVFKTQITHDMTGVYTNAITYTITESQRQSLYLRFSDKLGHMTIYPLICLQGNQYPTNYSAITRVYDGTSEYGQLVFLGLSVFIGGFSSEPAPVDTGTLYLANATGRNASIGSYVPYFELGTLEIA